MSTDAELTALAERFSKENFDLEGAPEHIRNYIAEQVREQVSSGIPPQLALDTVVEAVRHATGLERPFSPEQFALDAEVERLNAARRSWGMR